MLYCMVHIVVSRLVVGSFTIEGELLRGDSDITVAGFDVRPLQALKILSTPCCSQIGYADT